MAKLRYRCAGKSDVSPPYQIPIYNFRELFELIRSAKRAPDPAVQLLGLEYVFWAIVLKNSELSRFGPLSRNNDSNRRGSLNEPP
jgi:hypothetical protein